MKILGRLQWISRANLEIVLLEESNHLSSISQTREPVVVITAAFWEPPDLSQVSASVKEWGPERLTRPRGSELTSRPQCGTYGFFTHRSLRGTSSSAAMNWASIMFLKDKWTSLCTHHFFFLPKLRSLVNSETASVIVSLTTCMAWNDVMPGMGLTTSSTIISWSLMAKRDQRTSIWAKGRAEGNRPHPEFMRTTKYCYVRAHNISVYLKNCAICKCLHSNTGY